MTTTVAPRAAVTVRRPRIVGIDLARGLALAAMCTQHVFIEGPRGEPSTGWVAWVFRESAGRASVVFFVLSGVSLALITAGGSRSAEPAALRRRGLALVGLGLALTGTVWEASILQHYGLAFLLAPWLVRASQRMLSALTAAALLGGPVALLAVPRVDGAVVDAADGTVLDPVVEAVWDVLAVGHYPMVLWIGFFTAGVLLGRSDLHRRAFVGRLVGAGVVVALAAGLVVTLLGGPAEDGWRRLLETEGHSGMAGWTIQTGGVALALFGIAIALPASVTARLGALIATGSMSLTAYLLHIALVVGVFEFGVAPLGWSVIAQEVAFFALVGSMIACCVGLARWHRVGPAERVMKRIASPRV
ncbi:MAG: heparan-alpha-glucosaminide N-acetyltransferase domain-containing protein [Actinomycetota bacterium]